MAHVLRFGWGIAKVLFKNLAEIILVVIPTALGNACDAVVGRAQQIGCMRKPFCLDVFINIASEFFLKGFDDIASAVAHVLTNRIDVYFLGIPLVNVLLDLQRKGIDVTLKPSFVDNVTGADLYHGDRCVNLLRTHLMQERDALLNDAFITDEWGQELAYLLRCHFRLFSDLTNHQVSGQCIVDKKWNDRLKESKGTAVQIRLSRF